MKKISVIIPVYNLEKHIIECLTSLENQTFSNFEVIIIDDGSTDNSFEIISEFKSNSSMKIILEKQINHGVSAARNKGISLSTGEYICFIDGDDMVNREYLNVMYHAIGKREGYPLSICEFYVIKENKTYESIKSFEIENKSTEKVDKNQFMEKYLLSKINITICSLLVPKILIEKYNVCFSEGSKYSEDMEFVWKLLVHSENIYYTGEKLYYYKIRNDSAMSKIDKSRLDGYNLFTSLEEYLKKEKSDFFPYFSKYGKSKWVWSTLWQLSVASKDFKEFQNLTEIYKPNEHMRKLKNINNKKILLSSRVYLISPFIYYKIAKKIGTKKLSTRELVSK